MMQRHGAVDDATLRRIRGEFLEMPGLCLTCAQAQRLWGLDADTCRLALEILVEAKFLCQPAPGAYSRLTDGGTLTLRPAMARAGARRVDPCLQANAR